MVMREKLQGLVLEALEKLDIKPDAEASKKLKIEYPDFKLGDYSSNAALVFAKQFETKTLRPSRIQVAEVIGRKIKDTDKGELFETVEAVEPGFINFRLKNEILTGSLQGSPPAPPYEEGSQKILVEYFQPNIAKPLHIGHMRTAIIGDSIKRMLKYVGANVESDTHMGDWGTQFGLMILGYKKYGDPEVVKKDPVNELNKLYIKINQEADKDDSVHEQGKQEFVKLEQGDKENRKLWQQFVDWSMDQFLQINDMLDILPFDNHWPESFYEDKMPAVLEKLKKQKVSIESEGAQIINLEDQGLGIAIVVKSDGGTTYLLRDLATAIFRKSQGFSKQLYVVDSRQSRTLEQTYAILILIEELEEGEACHVDYGFISFKGGILSTRKGNMVLVDDLLSQAQEKIAKIIQEKNPDLKDKEQAIKAVALGALKYFDLKHNRHSDIEFDWDEVLDFEGDSGPYIQYAYTRLASILRKVRNPKSEALNPKSISDTERQIMFQISIFNEAVGDSVKEYLPNILANYLYKLATLTNKFYHESQVLTEKDKELKAFRLHLVNATSKALAQGLDLLGIKVLEEM